MYRFKSSSILAFYTISLNLAVIAISQLVSKYGCSKKESSSKRSRFPGSTSTLPQREETEAHIKGTSNWAFDEKVLLQSLYKVLVSVSKALPIILYIRDVRKLCLQSDRFYEFFQKMLDNLSVRGSVLILGSYTWDLDDEGKEMDEWLSLLFPYVIQVKEPDDETHLASWHAQLEEEKKMIQFEENRNHIAEVLAANDLDCDDLGSICHADSKILSDDHIEEIVISALYYHVRNNKDLEYRNRKLVVSPESLSHGLIIFQGGTQQTNTELLKLHEPQVDNEFEKHIKSEVIEASQIPQIDNEFEKHIASEIIEGNQMGVTFDDVGGLDDIKESLTELVRLPLRRPELFMGGLLKPCRGILLFGPPGTGKTMLAKAIANAAEASFINVSMSTIISKWLGDGEKHVQALFTLAAKISPAIIFVDEVDSMLGQRVSYEECEEMHRIKTEFMTHWDGLATKADKQILVLAATNRPFDLDEAIIRRFERRIMVPLPSTESREMILKTLLAKEMAKDLDFKELATMTDGYTGSDLKNLCMAAAYPPVRELLQQERKMKNKKKKQDDYEGQSSQDASYAKEEARKEKESVLRPINMEDMRQAKNQVAASFATEGAIMGGLKQWNALYGEGGSRKTKQLTYFL